MGPCGPGRVEEDPHVRVSTRIVVNAGSPPGKQPMRTGIRARKRASRIGDGAQYWSGTTRMPYNPRAVVGKSMSARALRGNRTGVARWRGSGWRGYGTGNGQRRGMISEEIDLDHEGVKGLDGESEWDWRRDGVIRSATDGGTGCRGERERVGYWKEIQQEFVRGEFARVSSRGWQFKGENDWG